MIRNVVFDIGSVLKGWNPELSQFFDLETAKIIESAIWGSGLWHEFDRGVFPEDEIIESIKQKAPAYSQEIDFVLSHLDEISVRFEYSVPWVKEIKSKGYKVYYLSNFSRIMREQAARHLDFIQYMDGGIFSCDVKLTKPDREIYKLFCEEFGLIPEECLFIDDKQQNVDAAIDFGMQSVRFISFGESYSEIMRLL